MKYRRSFRVSKVKGYGEFRLMVFFIIFLLLAAYLPLSSSQQANQDVFPMNFSEGQFLYSPMWSTATYLRRADGSLNRSWASSYFPGVAVWWLGNGTILRTIRTGSGGGTGGAGGGVQKVEWDGTVVWDFRYNTNGVLSHHDVKTLPNGNVLLIAWETKTRAEAIAAGRNPSYVSNNGFWPDHVIEVQPTGPTSGEIVWEWHVWDHLIQDFDASKANYGVIGDHPELVDINYATSTQYDWMHTNSIDYNVDFDQILISIHNFNEIWVIDHSTTTEEAADHTGGNSGKGGDLLYRWGNPMTYDAGTTNDRKLFSQHDASWIDEGCPGEGDILVFNNGANRPGDHYSTIDEITPPVDENGEYYLEPGSSYGPAAQTWIYTANPPTSFYASHISGAWRLPSGNTLITNGESGLVFEVTPEGSTVWQYNTGGQVFKVVYIPPGEPEPPENGTTPELDCSGSLSWTDIDPGATVVGSFDVRNIGDSDSLLNWTVNTSSISWGTWSFNPESGVRLTPEDGSVTVLVSVVAPNESEQTFQGFLRVENINDPTNFDTIPVTLTTPVKIVPPWMTFLQQFLSYFLHHHPILETIVNNLIS
jgi:hypothetical protein